MPEPQRKKIFEMFNEDRKNRGKKPMTYEDFSATIDSPEAEKQRKYIHTRYNLNRKNRGKEDMTYDDFMATIAVEPVKKKEEPVPRKEPMVSNAGLVQKSLESVYTGLGAEGEPGEVEQEVQEVEIPWYRKYTDLQVKKEPEVKEKKERPKEVVIPFPEPEEIPLVKDEGTSLEYKGELWKKGIKIEEINKDILEQNKDKEFVQRIINPSLNEKYEVIKNPNGTTSTHKMAAEITEDGRWLVYPTIVNRDGKLIELNDREAMTYAIETGEYIDFGVDKSSALSFAENGYKTEEFKSYHGENIGEKLEDRKKTSFWGSKQNVSQAIKDVFYGPDVEKTEALPNFKTEWFYNKQTNRVELIGRPLTEEEFAEGKPIYDISIEIKDVSGLKKEAIKKIEDAKEAYQTPDEVWRQEMFVVNKFFNQRKSEFEEGIKQQQEQKKLEYDQKTKDELNLIQNQYQARHDLAATDVEKEKVKNEWDKEIEDIVNKNNNLLNQDIQEYYNNGVFKLENELKDAFENIHEFSDKPLFNQNTANTKYRDIKDFVESSGSRIYEIRELIQGAANEYLEEIYPEFEKKYGYDMDKLADKLNEERHRFVFNVTNDLSFYANGAPTPYAMKNYAYTVLNNMKEEGFVQLKPADPEYKGDAYMGFDPETGQMAYTAKAIDERTVSILEEIISHDENDKTWFEGVYNGFIDRTLTGETLPVIGIIPALSNAYTAREYWNNITRKIERGEELDYEEKTAMMARSMQDMMNYQIPRGIGYEVGSGIADAIPYMVEFALTSGAFTVARKATKLGLTKILGGVADNVATKASINAMSFLTGALSQSTFNARGWVVGMQRRMTDQMKFVMSDAGTELFDMIQVEGGEDYMEALVKAYGENYIETFTERLGLRVPIPKSIKNNLSNFMARSILSRYMKDKGISGSKEMIEKAMKKMAWSDVFGEYGEEMFSQWGSSWLTGDRPVFEYDKDKSLTENIAANLWEPATAEVVLAIGGVFGGAKLVSRVATKYGPAEVTLSHRPRIDMPGTAEIEIDKEKRTLKDWRDQGLSDKEIADRAGIETTEETKVKLDRETINKTVELAKREDVSPEELSKFTEGKTEAEKAAIALLYQQERKVITVEKERIEEKEIEEPELVEEVKEEILEGEIPEGMELDIKLSDVFGVEGKNYTYKELKEKGWTDQQMREEFDLGLRSKEVVEKVVPEEVITEKVVPEEITDEELTKTILEEPEKAEERAREKLKEPMRVETLSVGEISVDPERFQYKREVGVEGVTGVIKEEFKQELAAPISVWVDPTDGKTYVVNGHNRLAAAKRNGIENINVQYIEAKDASEARKIGALQNIAEGRGTAIDAAKFIRESGFTPEGIRKAGVTITEKTASEGLSLSNLSDGLFNAVIQGIVSKDRGVILGRIENKDVQEEVYNAIKKKERGAVRMSNASIEELVDMANAAKTEVVTEQTLFGETKQERARIFEKANILARAKRELSKSKKLFQAAAKNAKLLEQANNQIDEARSEGASKEAATIMGVLDLVKNTDGKINEILNKYTSELAKPGLSQTKKSEIYGKARAEIEQRINEIIGERGIKRPEGVREVEREPEVIREGEEIEREVEERRPPVKEVPEVKPSEKKTPQETKLKNVKDKQKGDYEAESGDIVIDKAGLIPDDWVKAMKAYSSPGGFVPRAIFDANIRRAGTIKARMREANQTAKDLQKAVKKEAEGRKDRNKLLKQINTALSSHAEMKSLPESVRPVAETMRRQLNALSQEIMLSGAIKGAKPEINVSKDGKVVLNKTHYVEEEVEHSNEILQARLQDAAERNVAENDLIESIEIIVKGKGETRQAEYSYTLSNDAANMMFNPFIEIDEGVIKNIEDSLVSSYVSEALPESIRDGVEKLGREMRDISENMIRMGMISDDMMAIFDRNMGVYLTRTYKLYDDVKYKFKDVPEDIKNTAIQYYMNQDFTEDEALAKLEVFFNDEKKKRANWKKGRRHSKVVETSILKYRKDIPEELRNLWGEYIDPSINYFSSYSNMVKLIEGHNFFKDLVDNGEGVWFTYDKPTSEFNTTLDESPNDYLNKITGGKKIYTDLETAKAFNEFFEGRRDYGNLLNGVLRWSGYFKYSKTVLSPVTHARNFTSGFIMNAAAGRMFTRAGGKAFVAQVKQWSDFVSKGRIRKDLEAEIMEMYSLGVMGESVSAEEMREFFRKDIKYYKEYGIVRDGKKNIWEYPKKVMRACARLYQLEDDIHKAAAFRIEKEWYYDVYKKRHPEKSDKELRTMTAERAASIVRATYPTYSEIPKWIQDIRDSIIFKPFVAPFVSFTAESIRTYKNILMLGISEMKDPDTRSIGARRVLGQLTTTYALQLGIGKIISLMSGFDEWTAEKFKRFMPDWVQSSVVSIISEEVPGVGYYMNVGYMDPYNAINGMVHNIAMLSAGYIDKDEFYSRMRKHIRDEAIGQDLLWSALSEWYQNENNAVFNEETSISRQALDTFLHFLDKMRPGAWDSGKKIWLSLMNIPDKYGQRYDLGKELMSTFLGFRTYKYDYLRGAASNLTPWDGSRGFNARLTDVVDEYRVILRDKRRAERRIEETKKKMPEMDAETREKAEQFIEDMEEQLADAEERLEERLSMTESKFNDILNQIREEYDLLLEAGIDKKRIVEMYEKGIYIGAWRSPGVSKYVTRQTNKPIRLNPDTGYPEGEKKKKEPKVVKGYGYKAGEKGYGAGKGIDLSRYGYR